MTSIATLLATGEAWADEVDSRESPVPQVVVPAPAVVAPAPAPAPMPVPVVTPAPVPQATPTRSSLDATLTTLLVAAEPPAPPPVPAQPAAPRIQLGFRDGTSATLDPSSSSAQALEQLAQTLTRRD